MKRQRGLLGNAAKTFRETVRSLRRRVRERRQRDRLLHEYRGIDTRSLAAEAARLPAVEFLVLSADPSPAGQSRHARCLDSIRRQLLPAAMVTSIRERPLEGIGAALAREGDAPVAVCLGNAEVCDDATVWIGLALAAAPTWRALYADHVDEEPTPGPGGTFARPHLKPDFSWLYLLARNFVGPLVVYERRTLAAAVTRLLACPAAPHAADEVAYAVALEALHGLGPESVLHVRQPLATCAAAPGRPLHGIAAAALARRGIEARVEGRPADPALHRILPRSSSTPRVTIVIPTKNSARLVKACIDSLRADPGYDAYDVVVIDHDSDEAELLDYLDRESAAGRLSICRWQGTFNYAAMNNAAIRGIDAPLVLLLNNDVERFSSGWLGHMVATMELDPAIAAVGCLLTYPDGDVQHAGLVFSTTSAGFHGHAGLPHAAPGYRGRIHSLQEYSAVTGAMMLVRREAFVAVGGFDEIFPDDYNDVDLCLRLRQAGYRIAYTPEATAAHWESRTRTMRRTNRQVFETRWAGFFGRDPFYGPYFAPREFVPDAFERLWRERKTIALRDALHAGR